MQGSLFADGLVVLCAHPEPQPALHRALQVEAWDGKTGTLTAERTDIGAAAASPVAASAPEAAVLAVGAADGAARAARRRKLLIRRDRLAR
jgi:hypothetical protein